MKPLTRFQDLVGRPSTRIAIKVKGRILFINSGDAVAVLAEGNYVSLQQESSSYLLRESISDSPTPQNGVVFFQQPVEIGPS